MRIPVNEKATLLLGHLASVTPCTLVDLSLDGCHVRTDGDIRLERGARVELIFRVGETAFRLGGELEWTARSREFGVCFSGMSSRREAELVETLGELAAKREAEQARLLAAVDLARAPVERLSAEFAAKTLSETEARAVLERAASEACATKERLEAATKELVAAEKALKEHTATPAETENAGAADECRRGRRNPPEPVGRHGGNPGGEPEGAPAADTACSGFHGHGVPGGGAVECAGRILDVSLSGCRIRSMERFPVGIYRRVEVEFILDGMPFRLPGVIQSIHDRFTVGIRFVDLSERKREQLSMLMEEMEPAAGEAGEEN